MNASYSTIDQNGQETSASGVGEFVSRDVRALYDRGDYEAVLAILSDMADRQPLDKYYQSFLLATLCKQNDWDRLALSLGEFHDHEDEFSWVIQLIASSVGHLISERQYLEAKRLVDALLDAGQLKFDLPLHRARLSYEMGNYAASRYALEQAQATDHNRDYYGMLEIAVSCKLADWNQTRRSLQNYYDPHADMAWITSLMATTINSLIDHRAHETAGELLNILLQKEASGYEIDLAKFRLLVAQGEKEKVASLFQQAAKSGSLEDKDLVHYFILALALDKFDHVNALIMKLHEAGKLTERVEQILLGEINARISRGNYAQAATLLSDDVLRVIHNPKRYFAAARLEYEAGNARKALTYIRQFLDQNTDKTPSILALQNACFAKLHDWDQVRSFIEKDFIPGSDMNWSLAQSLLEAATIGENNAIENLILKRFKEADNLASRLELADTLITAQRSSLIIAQLKAEFRDNSSSPQFCKVYINAIYAHEKWKPFEFDLQEMAALTTIPDESLRKLDHMREALAFADAHSSLDDQTSDERIMDALLDGIFRLKLKTPYKAIENKVSCVGATMAAGGAEHVLINAHKALLLREEVDNQLWLHSLDTLRNHDHYLEHYQLKPHHPSHNISLITPVEQCGYPIDLVPTYIGAQSGNICEKILRERPSVVHAWQDSTNIECAIAGIVAGAPKIILHPHNMRPDKVHKTEITKSLRNSYKVLLQREDVHLVCCSEASLNDYLDWLGIQRTKNCHVVYNGFEWFADHDWSERRQFSSDYFINELGVDPEHRIVSGVFRLVELKQPMLWLDIARRIIERLDDVSFVLFGEGEYKHQVTQYIEQNGLKNRIFTPGNVLDAARHSASATLTLHTSRTEGLPTVIIEAFANGMSVVASNVGGTPECFCGSRQDMCTFVDGFDSAQFTRAIIHQLQQTYCDQDRFELSQRTRIKFGVDQMTNELLSLYKL